MVSLGSALLAVMRSRGKKYWKVLYYESWQIGASGTSPYNPKLNPNSHSRNTFFNHFFNQKGYYGNEDLSLNTALLNAILLKCSFTEHGFHGM